MKWESPPIIKIHEAIGSIADGRIEVSGDTAKVSSSSGNKYYTVTYEPSSRSIMVNDNGSFYQGYLGYPAIAYLMVIGELEYSPDVGAELKGIAWKDLNQRFKNDFDKTLEFILRSKSAEIRKVIETKIHKINDQLKTKSYNLLGSKVPPPAGY